MNLAPGTEIVQIQTHSDGDATHVPPQGWNLVDPPYIYLNKIAEQWLQVRGIGRPGVKCYLDKLPAGYRLYERPRPSNPKIVDKHLYGHPGRGRKYFDSPNRFYPHFEHLMNNNGDNDGCPCSICGKRDSCTPVGSNSGWRGPIKKIMPQPLESFGTASQTYSNKTTTPRPSNIQVQKTRIDDERTPDTVRHLLDKLKIAPVDQEIVEEFSLDWRASKRTLNEWLRNIREQSCWLPRQGEIILFVRDLQGNRIDFDNEKKIFSMFNEKDGFFQGPPLWEAGIIGQGPSETVTLEEIVQETKKTQNIAYSGFRVEPLSDANSWDKSLSKRYKYVPLHQIRPFVFWQEFLKDIPESEWHPTIKNALKVSSSIALVDKARFRGAWPEATVFCSGIYIGHEFVSLEDTVRLIPEGERVTDFLEVKSIKLKLTNLDKASDNDYDDGHPYNSTVVISGKAFTSEQSRAWNKMQFQSNRLGPKGIEGYDAEFLYWLHEPSKHYQVSFSRVLGRCFEALPMLMWFPLAASEEEQLKMLSYGLSGIQAARVFSSSNDQRILPGKTWYWGDTRLEALGAETLNNIHSSFYDDTRDDRLDEWQNSKVFRRRGLAGIQSGLKGKIARSPMTGKSTMAAAAQNIAESETEEDTAMSGNDVWSRKRSHSDAKNEDMTPVSSHRLGVQMNHIIEGDSEDDDDEIVEIRVTKDGSASDMTPLEAFKRPKVVINLE